MYHEQCFTGDADPRTQKNSSFAEKTIYHENTAPKISSLEGIFATRLIILEYGPYYYMILLGFGSCTHVIIVNIYMHII